eukprot:TRINITY_DN27363_c0_g1_i1.p1 TRINITY_DN27363_c0_g1~~TRINITY_DN27363_c0_g1_i1.p1  ORF type:complete len:475 (+),score=88.51 TRINITY_DN27363_c0_g1_i1:68-1426(+)
MTEAFFNDLHTMELCCIVATEMGARVPLEQGCLLMLQYLYKSCQSQIIKEGTAAELLFTLFDVDKDGFHNYEEAKKFEEATSGTALDFESWLRLCGEAQANPAVGLSYQCYTRLYQQEQEQEEDEEHEQEQDHEKEQEKEPDHFEDHALTAKASNIVDLSYLALGDNMYNNIRFNSAPTGALQESSLCNNCDINTFREHQTPLQMAATTDVLPASEGNPLHDVQAILAEVSEVTNLSDIPVPPNLSDIACMSYLTAPTGTPLPLPNASFTAPTKSPSMGFSLSGVPDLDVSEAPLLVNPEDDVGINEHTQVEGISQPDKGAAVTTENSGTNEAEKKKEPKKKRRSKKKNQKKSDEQKTPPENADNKDNFKVKRTTKGLRTTRLKTTICRNWTSGSCSYGDECGFAHGCADVITPQLPLCRDWHGGKCDRGEQCAFAHPKDEGILSAVPNSSQ